MEFEDSGVLGVQGFSGWVGLRFRVCGGLGFRDLGV